MNGRTRLSWVTALTVVSLLFGAGTLNALADDHGKGHGGGSGKVEQSASHGNSHSNAGDNRGSDDQDADDVEDLVTQPALVTDDVRPGKGCGDENHEHLRHDECPDKFLDDAEMELDDD
ncbi:MAG TPA: hypothetical protein VFG86_03810 [Chloroflexota bacterium]|jgi:hypothetical protein|nr:hypothetical protein [Chloroflexota bacterium]